jgi:membrane protease YdiL (CAAX protease family)
MRIRDIFVVIIFSLVMRAFAEILIANTLGGDPYFINLYCAGGTYLITAAILWSIIHKSPLSFKEIIGSPVSKMESLKMIILAVFLLAFTMGESAIEVMIMARVDLNFAYTFWPFHPERLRIHPIWSYHVLLFLAVNVLIAPVLEEFIFRGLLLNSLKSRMGPWSAILLNSLIFTMLHFSSHYYISTFVFAVVLCCVYLSRRSLLSCIAIHSAFNLFAFLHQYYADTFWTRSINQIASVHDWIPQIIMFILTSLFFLYLLIRYLKEMRSSANDQNPKIFPTV